MSEMRDALYNLLDNIFIRFGSKLYRQIEVFQWILIVTLLLQISLCFVMRDTQCCLFLTILKLMLSKRLTLPDELLSMDNSYFEQMVGQTYPTELQ